jgi:hypothetical protein
LLAGAEFQERVRPADRVSLLRAALTMQSARLVWAGGEPRDVSRDMRSGGLTGLRPTREGFLYLSANTPHFWRALCEKTGLMALHDDPRYDSDATPPQSISTMAYDASEELRVAFEGLSGSKRGASTRCGRLARRWAVPRDHGRTAPRTHVD